MSLAPQFVPAGWGLGSMRPVAPLPPCFNIGTNGGDATFCHFAAFIFEDPPRSFNIKFGGEWGGKDCTSGPKTDKIDATFRPPTVAPNALLHFCEVGDKGRDNRIAGIGKGKGTWRRNDKRKT